ncbi:MAG: hypothetical protein RSB41_02625 [Bacilli bacterium]
MINFIIEYWMQISFGFLISIVSLLYRKAVSHKKKIEKMQEGIQVLLKIRIIDTYTNIIKNEYITYNEKELILEMYKSYKSLGGNGVIKGLIEKIDTLEVRNN